MCSVQKLWLVLLTAFASSLAAQTKTASPNVQPTQAQQQQREVAQLREQIAELRTKVSDLEASKSLFSYMLGLKQDKQDSILLNLSRRTYQRLDMDNGFLLVSVYEAVPYLTGYKLTLKIGNPSYASYSGFTAKVKWGKLYKSGSESYADWDKALQEREVPFTDSLERGTWNTVDLIITPASAEQLEYLELSITTSTVELYEKK